MRVGDSVFQSLSGGNFLLFFKSHCGSAWLIALFEGVARSHFYPPSISSRNKVSSNTVIFHFTQFITVAVCLRKHTGVIYCRSMVLLRMKNWSRTEGGLGFVPLHLRTGIWKHMQFIFNIKDAHTRKHTQTHTHTYLKMTLNHCTSFMWAVYKWSLMDLSDTEHPKYIIC